MARGLVRALGPRRVLGIIDRWAGGYARRAAGSAWLPLPSSVPMFLETLAEIRGAPPTDAERRRLAGDRLTFLLGRAVVHLAMETWGPAEAGRRLPPIVVEGMHHLDAAVDAGRGAILVGAHFGIPHAVRIVLAQRGVAGLAMGSYDPWVDEVVGKDAWTRARTLRRVEEALGRGLVCTFLVDTRRHPALEVPVLAARFLVALGPFTLAEKVGCPVLPIFGMRPPASAHLRVSFGPRLETAPLEAAGAFGRLLDQHARTVPHQLFGFQPLFRNPRRPGRWALTYGRSLSGGGR